MLPLTEANNEIGGRSLLVPLCNSLLVVNGHQGHILYSFRDSSTNVPETTILFTRSHLVVLHGPITWEMSPLTEANNEIGDLSLSFHTVKPTRSSAIAKTAEHTSTILKLVLWQISDLTHLYRRLPSWLDVQLLDRTINNVSTRVTSPTLST